MKRLLHCHQYYFCILLLFISTLFFSCPAMIYAVPSAPSAPARGFIMDMAPLLGSNGRIKAIAPDCRAMTGFLDGTPFVWSRDFGLVRLAPPKGHFGMGDFLSDDGRSMLGFVSINDAIHPAPYSQTWARPGFIWRYGEQLQYMSKHGIADVEWYGLSADGKTALGYGKRNPPSSPAAAKGKAAENLELTPYHNRWFSVRNRHQFRVLDNIARPDASPYYRLLSRDGKKLLQKQQDNSVQIVDLQTGAQHPLTFGGVRPHTSPDLAKGEKRILRAGDPQNPLFHWGRWPGFRRSRLLSDSELKRAAPDSPLHADWILDDFFCSIPSFDARFTLCALYLKKVPKKPARRLSFLDAKSLTVLVRLDAKENDIPIDDGPALMGLDISDDGKTILYERDAEIWIWNEDLVLPHDSVPRPMPLARYLEHFGLSLPSEQTIKSAVMSPDGQCFFGELALYDDEQFPYKQFLACIKVNHPRPHWDLNSKKISNRGGQSGR